MTYRSRSLRLYLSNKTYVVAVPVITLAAMVVISVLIALVMGIVVGLPLPVEAEEGFRNNVGSLTALPGFLISLGALAVNRNFAMALAFGSTRRDFWCGTALGFTATSVVTALSAVVLLALEKATNGWFVHAHAFDVAAMGNGSDPKTFAMTLMLALLSLSSARCSAPCTARSALWPPPSPRAPSAWPSSGSSPWVSGSGSACSRT